MPKLWRHFALATLIAALTSIAQTTSPEPPSPALAQSTSSTGKSKIVVPAGTEISLELTSPIMAKTAKVGDDVYAETAFPVAVNNQTAIPPGTYVLGQIDNLTRPGWLSPHAELQIHFTKMIFANGYTVELPQRPASAPAAGQPTSSTVASSDDVIAAVASPYVEVSSSNDVLLDNGSQIDMVLQIPIRLNAAKLAGTVLRSNPRSLFNFKSASLCRPIPGTPNTVIPGTPGTPGTPPTVIPGGPGMPPTVIPGTPAVPGTPDTVIGGSSGVACPGPPVVIPNPKVTEYKQSFHIASPAEVFRKQLSAGTYQLIWKGPAPRVQVDILQNGKVLVTVPARMVLLMRTSPASSSATRTNSDGSLSVESLRFAGQSFALYFDHSPA